MTATERLAEIKARAEAATEGPWERRFYDGVDLPKARLVKVIEPPNEYGYDRVTSLADYLTPENAEFIAASRADVPALVAALEAVLERHRATEETSDGRHWCVHCYDHAGNMIEAPCPTVQAINAALGVDQ